MADAPTRRVPVVASSAVEPVAAEAPGLPVPRVGAPPPRTPRAPRRPRFSLRIAGAGLLIALVAVSALTLLTHRQSSTAALRPPVPALSATPSTTPTPTSTPVSLDLMQSAVREAASARVAAFWTLSTAPLDHADEPGSPAMAADRTLVQRLRRRGWRLDGLSFRVLVIRVLDAPPAGRRAPVRVLARVTTSAHRRLSSEGSIVGQVPQDGPRQVTLTLVQAGPNRAWVVRSVG